MAAALQQQLGVEAELIRGGRGVFAVRVNGVLVAEKRDGRFPTDDAVVDAVRAALPPGSPE